MNTDYIRRLLITFKNKNVYEIETALAIYEFINKDEKDISEEEIFKVYDLIRSQAEIYNDYVKEEIIKINDNHNESKRLIDEQTKKENNKQKEKNRER